MTLHPKPEVVTPDGDIAITFKISADLKRRLDVFCEQHSVTKREVITKAIEYAIADPATVVFIDGSVEDRLSTLEAEMDVLKQLLGPAVPR